MPRQALEALGGRTRWSGRTWTARKDPQQGGEGRIPLITAVGLLLVLARLLVGITRMHLMCLLTRVSFPDNVTANKRRRRKSRRSLRSWSNQRKQDLLGWSSSEACILHTRTKRSVPSYSTSEAPLDVFFSGSDSSVRSHVIQYLRANPLAQVWLAGTNRPPVLACHFNYDNDRHGFDRKECDLGKLIGELESAVQGMIVVFGYSSAVRHLSSRSRVVTEAYSD